MYSKFDDVKSGGAANCRTEPADPLPRLSPGPPTVLPLGTADTQQAASLSQLLPLPTAHFDHKSGKSRIDEEELRAYMKRLFAPFGNEEMISDLPAFLREAAAILGKK